MRFHETETVELKSIVMDDLKKEIIAFANCDGGTVYVGVADDGTVLGVENADECALQISNMVRDAVKPDVTMFIHYETLDCGGKAVVAVNIQRGTNRPYYLAKKGLRPEGVYVGCHPCINTSSIRFRTVDLVEKILPAMEHDYIKVKL